MFVYDIYIYIYNDVLTLNLNECTVRTIYDILNVCVFAIAIYYLYIVFCISNTNSMQC